MRKWWLFFSGILIGCGYSKSEGDKRPDIPVFPLHSNNSKFEIELLPYEQYEPILRWKHGGFSTICDIDTASYYSRYGQHILLLDENFNETAKFQVYSDTMLTYLFDGYIYQIEHKATTENRGEKEPAKID